MALGEVASPLGAESEIGYASGSVSVWQRDWDVAFRNNPVSQLNDRPSDHSRLQQAMGRVKPLWDRHWLFFCQSFSNFGTIGAIAPSSPLLAKAVVQPLQDRPDRPISVLEVGAGTGVITAQILKSLGRGDRLDVYELNPRFYRYLSRFLRGQDLQARGVRCDLHNADIRAMSQSEQYDFIVSGLPFNSFDVRTVDEILEVLMNHLTGSGVLAYFEYSLPARVRSRFLKAPARDRLQKVNLRIRRFTRKHQFGFRQVWWNLPPAKARYCRKKPADSGLPKASQDKTATALKPFSPLAER